MAIDHLTDRAAAISFLSGALSDGTLALFLGAGASTGADLPQWPELIRRLQKKSGVTGAPISDGARAETLQKAADEIREKIPDRRTFARAVNDALYEGVELSAKLLQSELLIAIGALLAGSRRGSVSRVVTLNYDSSLEWYIRLYGLVARVVSRHPTLEGSEDVRIYHPHGFLPHADMKMNPSDFVILGFEDVNLRLGTPGEPWFELMRHTFNTSVCLFMGLSFRSFEDRAIAPLIAATKETLRVAEDPRPTGFWLCEQPDPVDPDSTATLDAMRKDFLRANVVPIFWRDPSEVTAFLLGICTEAAKQAAA
jgi:hypothetical protein